METSSPSHSETIDQRMEPFRAILELLPTGVLVADANCETLFYNRAAREILGTTDAACTSVFGWYLPDKLTLLSSEELPLHRVLRGEVVSDELLFVRSARRPNGVWIRVTGRALQGAANRISSAFIIFRDVTEGRNSQQTSAQLSKVVEQIADGVVLTDKHGFIEYVNGAFERITGFSPDDVRGKTPRILRSGAQDRLFYEKMWSELLH